MKRALLGGLVVVGLLVPAPVLAQSAEEVQIKARQQITMMEGVLKSAVQNGVNSLRRRVRAIMPDDALIQASLAEVRGFPIEGYGVFFDVELPMLRQSMAWTLQQMNQSNALLAQDFARLRQFVSALPDPAMKAQLDRVLQNIQRQLGPVSPVVIDQQAPAAGRQGPGPAPQGLVAAQSVAAETVPAAATTAVPDLQVISDPAEVYTEEVKKALIDAMILYGAPLSIGANEWLTVAAKDNEPVNALVQADSDFRTIILRLRGSDLLEYQQGRLTLDQIRTRVSILEF